MTSMQTSAVMNGKRNGTVSGENPAAAEVFINGSSHAARPGERLIDLINRAGLNLPQVCYHPQLGPVQSCDTCMVEVDGKLVRACATKVISGMNVSTKSTKA